MQLKQMNILFYLILSLIKSQIEVLFNLILFIIIYTYKKINKLFYKEKSNLDILKEYIINNKKTCIHNIALFLLPHACPLDYMMYICTGISMLFVGEVEILSNIVVITLKFIYCVLTNKFFY